MTDETTIQEDIEDSAFREFAQLADQGLPVSSAPAGQADTARTEPAEGEQAEDTASGGEAAPNAGPGEDVWATATEAQRAALADLRARYERAEHSDLSNRGQVAALQRRLNDAVRELQEVKAKPPAAPQPSGDTPSGTDSSQQVDLKQFAEDFPEVFAAMQALQQQEVSSLRQRFDQEMQAIKQQFEGYKVPLEAVQAEREMTFRQDQLRRLGEAHPDYAAIQQSNDFWQWVDSQPDGVKSLAGSLAAAENIRLLNLYKLDKGLPQNAGTSPAPATPARRPRNPDDATALPRRGAPRMEGVPEDPDAAFRYWAQQADQNRP